ncbi:MAG TPA: PilZ domain-containing protein [Candidatus Dormibacteraeota bacterium]|nr:PilZ domain-containing protein [Candidatus Dormibacteraeota bacterium]
MDAGISSARQARAQHRHELRTLTYVTLDQANGGIVRNLTREGIGLQVVAAVRPRQQMRVRFELRYPRLRVETQGEVVWATFSGQCGIRFLDLPPAMKRQINEWIFGDLIEGISLHGDAPGLMFPVPAVTLPGKNGESGEDDGLMVSAAPVKVIELPVKRTPPELVPQRAVTPQADDEPAQLDWLSRPLTGRGLSWTINTLVVVAALLLCALVFLAVTRAVPQWPLAMAAGGSVLVGAMYWGFCRIFGGGSFGARLARMADSVYGAEEKESESRFR